MAEQVKFEKLGPSQAISGARLLFKVGGITMGYAGNAAGEESIDYQPIDTLNLLEVREFVPVAYRCTLNATAFRVVNHPLKESGIFPKEDNILTSGEMTAVALEKINKAILAQWEGVKCAGHSWDFSARGITSEAISFVAIRVKDEADITG